MPPPPHVRRLLVLTFRFPPQGRVGAHRTAKFVRYLGTFGWHPVVHTVSNPYCTHWDETLARQIPPDVRVFRTPTFEIEALEERLRALRSFLAPGAPHAAARKGSRDGSGIDAQNGSSDGPSRIRDWIWRRWLSPDPQIAWIPAALVRSRWIARRQRVSALYSTSPPHSVQLVALALRRRLGLPWIADMRDPWTEGLHRQQWYVGNERRRRREEHWEHAICREADRVLVATEGARDLLQTKYPDTAHKVVCLTNGFDPVDFAHIDPVPRTLDPQRLNVTLTGNVESAFDLMPLLRAIATVSTRRPGARESLRFQFVGTRRRPECDAFLAERGLEEVVLFRPPMPHPDCLQVLSESQVALIAAAERQRDAGIKISAKLFEYLYLRKPVLALIRPGITTGILDRAGLGFHAEPDDEDAIARRLGELLDRHEGGGIRVLPDESYIAAFDRRTQSETLASLLDEISSGR